MNTSRTLFFSILVVSSALVFAGNEPDKPTVETSKKEQVEVVGKVSTEATTGGVMSVVGNGVAALVYSPVNLIDWVGEKAFVKSGIARFAVLGCLKDNRFGRWFDKHNEGLSRAVIVAVLGSAVYYYWKKYQELKQEEDGSLRTISGDTESFDFNIDDEDLFGSPSNDVDVTKSA